MPRIVDAVIADLFAQLPALMLVGHRATGKTTTAARHVKTVVRLDRESEAESFRADPDGALHRFPEPILLDEWQAVPEVLGAVKRAVDGDFRPGRFILTGSVWGDFQGRTWPGTGRVVRVDMTGLSVREIVGDVARKPFIDAVVDGDLDTWHVPDNPPDLGDYVDLALRSGFPELVKGVSGPARTAWLASYIDQIVTRDIDTLDGGRDPRRLRAYFEAVAINTSGVATEHTLAQAAQVDPRTAQAYDHLLRDLLVVDKVPAWFSNRLKRLIRSPKRYLVDPALIAGFAPLTTQAVLRDGDLLGRLIDNFVYAQLRAELPACASMPRIYHLRQEQGRHEVDIVLDLGIGRLIGVEVKAKSAPKAEDAKHLMWLRDQFGDKFVAGIVFHTGKTPYQLSERIIAAPIWCLWA